MFFVALCYFSAFLLELYQIVRQHNKFLTNKSVHYRLNLWKTSLAALGFFLHTLFIYRNHAIAEHPVGGTLMLFLVAAWGLLLLYFIWQYSYRNILFGIVLLPLALLLLIGYSFSASWIKFSSLESSRLAFHSTAKMLHVIFATGTVIALLTGGLCRILYVTEAYLLRQKRPLSAPMRLPSLEWSLTAFRISMQSALVLFLLTFFIVVLTWVSGVM